MRCPSCGIDRDKVIDSRAADDGAAIRRRRECEECGRRFTTYERIERAAPLMVVKRDGTRVPFDTDRLARGVLIACGKRPIPVVDREALVREVEESLQRDFEKEVESREIGRRVAARLRDLDSIAYIRFASEHYDFKSLDDLIDAASRLRDQPRDLPNQRPLFPENQG
jgi:transcriptional repressor NrdR